MGVGADWCDKCRCRLSGKKCLEGCGSEAEATENRWATTVRILFAEGEAAFTAVQLEGPGLAEQVHTVRWHEGVEASSSGQVVCFDSNTPRDLRYLIIKNVVMVGASVHIGWPPHGSLAIGASY